MTDLALNLLQVLADLDDDVLGDCYLLERPALDADLPPFEEALWAWRRAGCPMPGSLELPSVDHAVHFSIDGAGSWEWHDTAEEAAQACSAALAQATSEAMSTDGWPEWTTDIMCGVITRRVCFEPDFDGDDNVFRAEALLMPVGRAPAAGGAR